MRAVSSVGIQNKLQLILDTKSTARTGAKSCL